MKKNFYLSFLIFIFFGACSSDSMLEDLDVNPDEMQARTKALSETSSTGVTLQWNSEIQEMDGFGFAEATWANYLYANEKRSEVLDLLLGENGLRCNILRGQVFPGYAKSSGVYDFETDVNTDIMPNDPYFAALPEQNPSEEYSRRGQLWLCKEAKNKYAVDKLIFSVWTPPAYMKSNGSTSKGFLREKYFGEYATYLAEFCKAYNNAGLDVYAVSPANEPEFAAGWNSCLWLPSLRLGRFIAKNMYPTFQSHGLNTKIIFGENAQWSTFAIIMGSKKYVEHLLCGYPEVANMNTIAAGHGYVNPLSDREITIERWPKAEKLGLKVWLTEVSMSKNSDFSMNDAINWAVTFHKYIATANTSAIVWWGGAIRLGGSECLISLNSDRKGYEIADRYYTFGNFSRYIKAGSRRIGVNKGSSIPGDLLVSAFKKGNEFVSVAVNPLKQAYTDELVIDGMTIKELKCIVTDENNKWKEEIIYPDENGRFPFSVPARSVVTFVGTVN